MSATKITRAFATAQIATALAACIKHSAVIDTANWPPNYQNNGDWYLDVLTDYHVRIKGFEATGAVSVNVRFDTEFENCILSADEQSFLWNGKDYHARGAANTHNFQFYDADGQIIDPDDVARWWSTHFDFSDIDLSIDVVNATFAMLSYEDTMIFLKAVLDAHNRDYKAAKQA